MLIFNEIISQKCDSSIDQINKLPKEILQKIMFYIFEESCLKRKCYCDLNVTLMKEIRSLSKVCTRWKEFFMSRYFINDFFQKYYLPLPLADKYLSAQIEEFGVPLYNDFSYTQFSEIESMTRCKCDTKNKDDKRKIFDINDLQHEELELGKKREHIYDNISYDKVVHSYFTSVNVPELSYDVETRTSQFMNIMSQLYMNFGPPPNRDLEGPNVVTITKEEREHPENKALPQNVLQYMEDTNKMDKKCFPGITVAELDHFKRTISQKVEKMDLEEIETSYKKMLEERNKMLDEIINEPTKADISIVIVDRNTNREYFV